MDPFAALGLPRRQTLDLKAAAARHLELSRTLHPDRHAGGTPAERRMSLSRAIEVNEAFRAVRDPVRRAEAILALEGLSGEVGETREPRPPPEVLMDVMEAREQLAEAKAARDVPAVQRALSQAEAQYAEAERALGTTIDEALGLSGEARLARLREAIPLLGRLRYAARSRDEAVAVADALEGF